MVKIVVSKQSNNYGNPMLVPVDADAMGRLSKLSDDHELVIEFKRNRSTRQHRLFWAMITIVFDNLPERFSSQFGSVEKLEKYLVGRVGYVTRITDKDGQEWLMPDSIARAYTLK